MKFNSFYSRRDLLKFALYATASSLFYSQVNSKNNNILKNKKIVVVGAGISGLSAAKNLLNMEQRLRFLKQITTLEGELKQIGLLVMMHLLKWEQDGFMAPLLIIRLKN